VSPWRNKLAVAVVVGVLVVFTAGLWHVFAARFGAGDLHPPYSTLNTSPQGTRALYDAFTQLGTPAVERNVLPLARFRVTEGTTLVFAGANRSFFGDDTVANFGRFEAMMRSGLHVVVALDARSVPETAMAKEPVADPWKSIPDWSPAGRSRRGQEDEQVSAGERWQFQFEPAVNPSRAPKDGWEVTGGEAGPAEWPRWFSVWRWERLGPEWQSVAEIDGQPVAVRRAFGQGSLLLLSDTVFLSNEALWRSPKPEFLMWLLGREPRLVFDETLHGTQSSPGVMYLMRRYRLLGFFVGAATLLGLFVWRSATCLVPVHPSVAEAPERPLAGVEGASGFSNLLRQTVPPSRLLRACFTEWAKSPLVRRRVGEAAVVEVRDLVLAAEAEPRHRPVPGYRSIVDRLEARRRGRG